MPSITRDRGCLYYVPWLATFCVCIGVAGLGVWAYYTKECRDLTLNAVEDLDIQAKNIDRVNDGLVATAITYLVVILCIYLMSLWRSFIEAAHDAMGVPAKGALAYLIISFLFISSWVLITVWMVLLLMANTVWASVLYVLREAITQSMLDITKYGQATWLPSQNKPCPGQCLDLTTFVFLTSAVQDACICDPDKLLEARSDFNRAYDQVPGVLSGSWAMLLAAILLLINYACAFSHTKRERELLLRASSKTYSGI